MKRAVPVLLALGVLMLAGLVLALYGCGSEQAAAPVGDVEVAEDIEILGSDPVPLFTVLPSGATEKVVLTDDVGHSGHIGEGSFVRHTFWTYKNVAYVVLLWPKTCGDDPDLYIGRSPSTSPTGDYLRRSVAPGPSINTDGCAFRAAKDGWMYIVVNGADGGGDGMIDYEMVAARLRLGLNTY